MSTTKKRKTGDLGENIATMFLMKRGFDVLERNHLRKWGEIDIIAKKDGKLTFVEVKTVSCVTSEDITHETVRGKLWRVFCDIFCNIFFADALGFAIKEVTHETNSSVSHETEGYRPEDNLHSRKLQRLRHTIQTYLAEKGISEESDWQFDAMCVYLDEKGKRAEVECIKDIIL